MRFAVVSFWLGLCLLACVFPSAHAATDPIEGMWYTEGNEGGVELYACANKICGRFYWLDARPGEGPPKDDHNPDLNKRGRILCHLQFMGDFTPDGKGHYEDGWIYSPRHGQNFSADMTLADPDRIDLHGYVLTPLFGESQTWKRSTTMPKCQEK